MKEVFTGEILLPQDVKKMVTVKPSLNSSNVDQANYHNQQNKEDKFA